MPLSDRAMYYFVASIPLMIINGGLVIVLGLWIHFFFVCIPKERKQKQDWEIYKKTHPHDTIANPENVSKYCCHFPVRSPEERRREMDELSRKHMEEYYGEELLTWMKKKVEETGTIEGLNEVDVESLRKFFKF